MGALRRALGVSGPYFAANQLTSKTIAVSASATRHMKHVAHVFFCVEALSSILEV
jgi:hypothetical protein